MGKVLRQLKLWITLASLIFIAWRWPSRRASLAS